jgi:hypothetical protein
MNPARHRVIFTNKDDDIPVILGYSHGLKEKNLCTGISTLLFENDNYSIVKKVATLNDKEIDIFLTYYYDGSTEQFVRGFVYIDDKEYSIKFCAMYASLQIEQYCYDRIMLIQLDDTIFE